MSSIGTFFIAGIGASAGGLQALKTYFEHAEPSEQLAYIIVQHLPSDYKSIMPELLLRHTKIPVQIAQNGMLVKANNIYLMPNQYSMIIKKGRLMLIKKESQRLNLPIDIFFRSLAIDQKQKAIGIILSGTGADGTQGMAEIQKNGGMLLVQSPQSAEFSGMPTSVIDAGLTDYILPAEDMYQGILESINHPNVPQDEPEDFLQGEEETVLKILSLIKSINGKDFTYYKRPTIHRSITKRMRTLGIGDITTYLNFLIKHDEETVQLSQQFLVGTTQFFRDKPAFSLLAQKILPESFRRIDKDGFLKVWIIGCSTGEEAYSIAILLNEYIEQHQIKANLRIFGTDINKEAIIAARKGLFPKSIAKDIPQNLLKKYFKHEGDFFAVRQNIRRALIFTEHDVTQNPPYSGLDLVICRNMLIYMQPVLQKKVLTIIQFSLKLNAYMMLGNSESAQELSHSFQIINIKWKLYKNADPSKGLIIQKTNILQNYGAKSSLRPLQSNLRNNKTTFEAICMALLQESDAACVLVDINYNIIEALGAYKNYLNFSENKLVLNLLKMVVPELSAIVVATVSKSKKQNEVVLQKNIRVEHERELKFIRILVKPLLLDPLSREQGHLIVFNNDDTTKNIARDTQISQTLSSPERKVIELQTELEEYKRTLQAIMEEVDISNQELSAINEELTASNEQLQAANEELLSINAEFQVKNKELVDINNDMEYFMENAEIGTLLLDKNMAIRRFNNSMRVHYNLISQDIGRFIGDFQNSDNIVRQAQIVLKTLEPVLEEKKEKDGSWFQRKIVPYLTESDKVEGVVVTYVDLTAAKRKQQKLEESEERLKLALKENIKITKGLGDSKGMFEKIMYTMPAVLYLFDIENMTNTYFSRVEKNLGYTPEDLLELGADFIAKKCHPEDLPRVVTYLEKTLKSMPDEEISRIEYRMKHKDNAYRSILSVDAVFDRDENNKVSKVLGIALDITDKKGME